MRNMRFALSLMAFIASCLTAQGCAVDFQNPVLLGTAALVGSSGGSGGGSGGGGGGSGGSGGAVTSATPHLIQALDASFNNSTVPSLTSSSFTATVGNVLIATVTVFNPTAVLSVTDSAGNAWTALPAITNSNVDCGGQVGFAQIWYAPITHGGSLTVNAAFTPSSEGSLQVLEYANLSTSGIVSGGQIGSSAASTATSSGTVAASGSSNLVLAYIAQFGGGCGGIAGGTGYNLIFNGTVLSGCYTNAVEVVTTQAAGSFSPTGTVGNPTDCWASPVAVFKPTNAPLLSTNLIASYGFSEGSGTTTSDASGNGNTLNVSAAWAPSGHTGDALSFDGISNDATNLSPVGLTYTNALTSMAWVYPTVDPGSGEHMIINAEGPSNLFAFEMEAFDYATGSGRPSCYAQEWGGIYAPGLSKLALNTWTHLACVYDGASINLYVNGTLAATGPTNVSNSGFPVPIDPGANSINVSYSPNDGGDYFKGDIDEVRLYNRALSSDEIVNAMITSP